MLSINTIQQIAAICSLNMFLQMKKHKSEMLSTLNMILQILTTIIYTKIYCDIELDDYLQILVNKHGKLGESMLGVLDIITKFTFPALLINKLISFESSLVGKY